MLHRAISRLIGLILAVSFLLPVMGASADVGGPTPTLVKDINLTISSGSDPQAFMQAGDVTFFFIKNEQGSNELKKTDGTGPGTTLVKQGVGPAGIKDIHKWISPPGWYAFYKGVVFFAGKDDAGLTELWRTDGSEAGTFKVLTSNSLLISDPTNMFIYNDNLYLIGGGIALYKIYNTSIGVLFMNFLPTVKSNVVGFNGSLFYITQDFNTNTSYLNKVDLAMDSVYSVTTSLEPNPDSRLKIFNGTLYFSARETGDADPLHGWELWRMDTSEQFTLVKDIHPTGNASPAILGETNGWLIFSAQDGTNGFGIWRTDGTLSGSTIVKDFAADQGTDLSFQLLDVVGGRLALSVSGVTSDSGLWTTDGSTSGTVRIGEIPEWDYFVWTVFNNLFYYSASSSIHGIEVWVTDGTTSVGSEYRDIYPGARGSLPLAMAPCGARLCISANDGQHGTELWTTSGDPTDTILSGDFNLWPVGSAPENFITAGQYTYFFAKDTISTYNLWRTDGSPAGTIALNLDAGVTFTDPIKFQADKMSTVGERIFLSASDSIHGMELWITDGSLGGTGILKDIRPGTENSYPQIMTTAGGQAFFTANDGQNGTELWVSDGSQAGTHLVKAIIPPGEDAKKLLSSIAPYGNKVVFVVLNTDLMMGDLWISDGTEEGTTFIATLADPLNFTQANGLVYFSSRISGGGEARLFQTNGTPEGTIMTSNLGIRDAYKIKGVGSKVFVITNDEEGVKLWVMRTPGSVLELLHVFYRINEAGVYLVDTVAGKDSLAISLIEYDEEDYEAVHLWMSDGTVDGTVMASGSYDFIYSLQADGGGFVFNAESGAERRQIWQTDGTAQGTKQLTHFAQRMCSQFDMAFLGRVIMLAIDDYRVGGSAGCELWALDMRVPQAFLPVVTR